MHPSADKGKGRRQKGEWSDAMSPLTRREFLKKTATDAALAGFLAGATRAFASPLGLPVGSQTYPHRERIVKGDFAGLLKDMKGIGIEVIELCNPAYKEFSSLADGKQTRKILDDNGMKCLSAHFTMPSLRQEQGKQIEWAQALGMTMMSTATLSARVTNGMTTLEEVKRAADEYNKIAAGAKKAGLQQILHNEGFENSRLEDGRLTYPVLMEYLDPDLVKMQFQMSSMRTVGDPIMYFMNHPGRFISAHMQGVDTTQGMVTSRAGFPPVKPTPEEAAAAAEGRGRGGRGGGGGGGNALALGEDSVDWPKVFTAAKTGGLKAYFVEQNWDLTVKSVNFLKTLNTT
jgi:sugar phosphate isomerase/epimerase